MSGLSGFFDRKKFETRIDKEGLVWEEREQFERATEAYDKLLADIEATLPANKKEENGKNATAAYLQMRKAGILLQTGKAEKGEQLMSQALQRAEQSGDSLIIARAQLGIGVFYGSIGRLKEGETRIRKALKSFSKRKDYDSKQGCGWALLNLGGLYRKQGKLLEAERCLLKSIRRLKAIKNWVGVASAYEQKAKVDTDKGKTKITRMDLSKAISFYEKEGMKEKADSLRKSMQE